MQILSVLKSLELNAFLDTLKTVFNQILVASETSSMNLNVVLGAQAVDDSLLQLAGTFQGALHLQITNSIADCLALVFSHSCRNGNFQLLLSQEPVWNYLLRLSFNPSVIGTHLFKKKNRICKSSNIPYLLTIFETPE